MEGAAAQLCLVTGATGFIGEHLVRRLLHEGSRVRCLVRAGSEHAELGRLGAELVGGDLASERALAEAADGCAVVFHCAALVSDWATRREIVETNVTGTRRLLGACAAAGVGRFVHFSSTDVYGYPGMAAIEESYTATRFRNWYSHTKLQAEREVERARDVSGLGTVVLRPATVYGPGSGSVIGEIARALCAGNMLLIDRGRQVAGLCYVENLIDATMLCATHESAVGEAFNVTDGLTATWRELTDALAAGLGCREARWSVPYPLAAAIAVALELGYRALRTLTGLRLEPLLSRQAVHVLGVDQDFSNEKLRTVLGWEPGVDFDEGIAATLAWLTGEYLATAGR